MKLTQRHLQAIYSMLAAMPPFDRYKLPSDARVQFKINRSAMTKGTYEPDPHTITVSRDEHSDYQDVVHTVAHELTHLALEVAGKRDHANHCAEFNALAAEVCTKWNWDFKTF